MSLKRSRDRRSPRFQIETASPENVEAAVALAPQDQAITQTGACPGCADDEGSAFLLHGPTCPDITARCEELNREVTSDKEPGERKRFHRGMALFMTALFLFPIVLKFATAFLGNAGLALSLFFMFSSIGGAIALSRAKEEA